MSKLNRDHTSDELIQICHNSMESNTEKQVDPGILKKNNLTPAQWKCFIDLIKDLDLNTTGTKILLEEAQSGRVLLACDR